jgi:hypothetical protein
MLPGAVRIMVEGMPGLELPVWGQEIPLMTTAYGGFTGETDDEELLDEDDGLGLAPIPVREPDDEDEPPDED